ncbi:AAA domain-containing protein [Luteimicrobium subarcticum]|uniref:AAA domain-containing protein n=2 Tax=Luteimicrobium subarcticum TaxID=620910 RepID=A0A2M8WRL3_9MICO|nr:AAA domain-containing protein [Luteimicrobium subarcticum]
MKSSGTVVEIARERWKVELTTALEPRFLTDGWSYESTVTHRCPRCRGGLHALRKPYTMHGRTQKYVAVVCPTCAAAFTLKQLGLSSFAQLLGEPSGTPAAPPRPSPVPDPRRAPRVDAGGHEVVRYWRAVELFGSAPALPDRPVERPSDVERQYEVAGLSAAPWEPGHRLRRTGWHRATHEWRHVVFGGTYQVDRVHATLGRVFEDDGYDVDERTPRGRSALFVVSVAPDGRLLPNTLVLSSAAWSLGRALSPGPTSPTWLDGFDGAQEMLRDALTQRLVAAEEAAALLASISRGLAGTRAVAVDVVVRFVEHVAKVLGIADALLPVGMHVRSRLVRTGQDPETAQPELLNSFYADDLGRISAALATGRVGSALVRYLSPVRTDERRDVRAPEHLDAVLDLLSPARVPRGRWPEDPQHPLTTSQQLAINHVMRDLATEDGVFGVNGPPGTGKTTMLRDLVAAVVTERASALAELPTPTAGFETSTTGWRTSTRAVKFAALAPRLTGFEMLVASQNNGAVENVTRELPATSARHARWANFDYFGREATRVLGEPAWGLVAATLGRKSKRDEVVKRLWFDADDPHAELDGDARSARWLATAQRSAAPGLWRTAVEAFRAAVGREEWIRAERQEVWEAVRGLPEAERALREAGQEADRADENARLCRARLSTAQAALAEAGPAADVARRRRSEHRAVKPSVLEILLTLGRTLRRWDSEDVDLAAREQSAERCEQKCASDLSDARDDLVRADERRERAQVTGRRAHAEVARMRAIVQGFHESSDVQIPDGDWQRTTRGRELVAPWLDERWNVARTDVFLAALDLHRAFIAAGGPKVRALLGAAMDAVKGTIPHDAPAEALAAAWQGLFLLIPVVSTTFASVGRMLRDVGPGTFGWLLVDEAGQATPQQAVGAMWRSRRVVAVGDPLQLEPVVTVLHSTDARLRTSLGVDDAWAADRESVQTLADRVTTLGTTLRGPDDAPLWVGSPLRVHRRCDNPMFTVVNEAVYGGLMIHGDPGAGERYDVAHHGILPSAWCDVRSEESDGHWIPAEGRALAALLRRLRADGVPPEQIMVIGPFRQVAAGIHGVVRSVFGADDARRLVHGTVHVSQGKQADVVIVVLGGNPARPGARAWAAERPNLMNVAVSRAKHRIFVIGDRQGWQKLPHFSQLARELPVHSGA